MRSVVTRGGMNVACEVRGNVVWLTIPPADERPTPAARCLSLNASVMRLSREVERSQELRSEIAAAIAARRYELYKIPRASDASAANRMLATAQRSHLGSLLRFIHAAASARSDGRAGAAAPTDQADALARSIESLRASVTRARELSQELLAQCRHRDRC